MRNPFKRAKKTTRTDQLKSEKGLSAATVDESKMAEGRCAGDVEGRLVVMGHESMFSDEVVDYAVDMALRMSYEILALNSAPLPCDSFNLFSSSRNKLCHEFKSSSESYVTGFRKAAEAKGVPFVHVVKFDEPEQALASLQKEFGNIEFVIADAQPQAQVDRVAQTNQPKSELLVYSMI